MADTILNSAIRDQALLLAREARLSDPCITEFYWFPAEDEVRLVELATDMLPSRGSEVQAFYFPPAPAHNMPAPSGVALIRVGENESLSPPEGWGSWASAVKLDPVGAS